MRLLNQKDKNVIPDLYGTESVKLDEKIVYAKFFTPDSNWTWYVMEISHKDYDLCFGYIVGHEKELGYFSIRELESVKGPLGLKVERDITFKPTEFKNIKKIENIG